MQRLSRRAAVSRLDLERTWQLDLERVIDEMRRELELAR
jgi:hypothetical protein